jgi:glycosyltransferase involved in cell wall biosynthesis
MATSLKIDEDIIWLGALNRQQSYSQFQDCNCFVLPSRHESFGIVYAEALACGKPIIATRCGGPEDIVKDLNGLLCEIDDPRSLADAMLTMIKNYGQYDSQQIYQDFVNNFSAKIVTSKIERLYHNVLQQD